MQSTTRMLAIVAAAVFVFSSIGLGGADWPQFRGPGGAGVSAETGLPLRWSDSDGVVWKAKLPGYGASSPIIVDGRVYLTCYSGYGVGRGSGGSQDNLRLHVVCLDAKSGKITWDKSIAPKLPEARYSGIGIPNHGYASSTPVTDGTSVFAFFGKSGVVAFDIHGKQLWRSDVDPNPKTHMFGSGSSLILYENLVIVPASVECEALIAYDKETGKEVFRERLSSAGSLYASPVAADGKLYVVSRRNGTFVFDASPAISGGKLYLRSNLYLYCVGKK